MSVDFSLQLKEDYSRFFDEGTIQALDNNGAFDDGVVKFEELVKVLDKDGSGGLNLEEFSATHFEDLDLSTTFGQTAYSALSDETQSRLKESGALDDNLLTVDELFEAIDTDSDGEMTVQERESARRDLRELYEGRMPEGVMALYDEIGAFDDNYLSLEEQHLVQEMAGGSFQSGADGPIDISSLSEGGSDQLLENLQELDGSTVIKIGDLEVTVDKIFLVADELLREHRGQGISEITSEIIEQAIALIQNNSTNMPNSATK